MIEQEQIKALAELDGWTEIHQSTLLLEFGINNPVWAGRMPDKDFLVALPNYLTSYDAIIPLIQKLGLWYECLQDYQIATPSPSQLCEALLRATGKWTDR